MKAKIEVELDLPSLPNFIRMANVQMEAAVGQTGKGMIDVADLSDDDIRKLGSDWTVALLAHAKKRREGRNNQPA